jgi:hypothetical protein
MSEKIPLELEIDISDFVQNLDLSEEGLENLKKAAEGAGKEVSDELVQATKETEKNAKATKGNATAWQSLRQTFVAVEGPMGGVSSRLGAIGKLFQSMIIGIKGATVSLHAFRLALLATGVGAIIVAIGTMITLLRRLQPVMDGIERAFGVLSITMDFAATKLGAFLGLNEDVNKSLGDTIRANDRLIKQQQALRDIDIELIEVFARLEKEIRQAEAAVRDETKSLEDRQKTLVDLERLQSELIETELIMAKNRRDIAQQLSDLAENDAEANRELAEARAEVLRIEGRAAQMERRFFRERQRLSREVEAEEKRIEEERWNRFQDRMNNDRERILMLEKMRAEIQATQEAEGNLAFAMMELDEILKESLNFDVGPPIDSIAFVEQQIRETNERIRQSTTDSERRRLAEQRKIYEQQLASYQNMADGIQKANFTISEQAIAADIQRAENAKEGARSVLRAIRAEAIGYAIRTAFASGGPLAPIVAGGLIGAANLLFDQIPGFAKGGDFLTSGPTPILVGDNPGGVERVSITPISSPNINGPDFRDALADVNWEVDFGVPGDQLAFTLRKTLRKESQLGGNGAL